MSVAAVYHFSEDPRITVFRPHVPATNPAHAPAVWAIDAAHAPLYWFPRDCPRVTAWSRNDDERRRFERAFTTVASRVHAIESAWLAPMRTTRLYRYELPAAKFSPWTNASGQWIAEHDVEPSAVVPVGDLLDAHAAAGIDLRIVSSLWPIHDLAVSDDWDFSIVRMANAQPRPPSPF